jgi:hypothetical protein
VSRPDRTRVSRGLLLAFCTGCSASSMSSAPVSFVIPGFIQTIKLTKCGLGSGVHEVSAPGTTEWVGSEGAFVVDLSNQSSFCLTNPFRPLKGPSATEEISEVKAYFASVGMPSAQVGDVSTSYFVDSSGEQFVSVKVQRVVDGVPVPESSAWASLVKGESVGEGVYWPALPASVSKELAELQAILANPSEFAAFQAKLQTSYVTGSIVIHHTSISERVPGHPDEEVALVAHACYDALIAAPGGLGMPVCYLPDGSIYTFPSD